MVLQLIDDNFCVCKINSVEQVNLLSDFFFFAKTDGETSLVCKEQDVPKDCQNTSGIWRAMRVVGTLDFALVGILSRIASILAKADVPIFAVSTFDTDYILVKENYIDKAIGTLKENGYIFVD